MGASLHVENAVGTRGRHRLQDGHSHVVYRAPSRGFTVGSAVMCMSVHHEVRAMAVDYFHQSRASQVWEYLGWLTLHSSTNRRIMHHNHRLGGSQLRECPL